MNQIGLDSYNNSKHGYGQRVAGLLLLFGQVVQGNKEISKDKHWAFSQTVLMLWGHLMGVEPFLHEHQSILQKGFWGTSTNSTPQCLHLILDSENTGFHQHEMRLTLYGKAWVKTWNCLLECVIVCDT